MIREICATGSPSVVLFDFGGTLDAAGLPWKDRIFRLYRAEGIAVTPERFDPLFHRADDAMVGTIPSTFSFGDTVRRLVTDVSAAHGVDDPKLTDRVATRFLDDAMASLQDCTPLLSRLARRYRLGVVSNFYGNLSTVCKDAGLDAFFTVIVDSTRVGSTKPDPRIFRYALGELGLRPGDATFVGDSLPRDMAGARGVAMPHIWLIGDTVSEPRPCCPRDPVIRSLEELQELLL